VDLTHILVEELSRFLRDWMRRKDGDVPEFGAQEVVWMSVSFVVMGRWEGEQVLGRPDWHCQCVYREAALKNG
jgi:hypothetical protein